MGRPGTVAGSRLKTARRHLLRAENLAMSSKRFEEAFEVYVELLLLARADGDPRAEYYRKRCERYLAATQGRTPSVRAFERILRAGEAS